jgi:tRNA U34 5-methylaminomethyl-2-thiouridine-forming methyltransferase MnmC
MDVELQLTSDGSHTLFNPLLNETYHSSHGALQESLHVFIKAGLEHLASRRFVRILEIGFGTGLNALLTIQAAHALDLQIDYTAVEAFPLDPQIIETLNYPHLIGEPLVVEWFSSLHATPWEQSQAITQHFSLLKHNARIQDLELTNSAFDLVYFDAFAPEKQPEMWHPEILKKTADALSDGGCLVTYCAKGQVKRDLRAAGLIVESLAGPPGKREMIRATRPRT